MRARPRAIVLVPLLVVAALGLATSRNAALHPDTALGGGMWWEGLLQVAASLGAVTAGLYLAVSRRLGWCGAALALVGPTILLSQLPVPFEGSSLIFTVVLVAGHLAPALAAVAAVTFPVVAVGRLDASLAWLTVTLAVLVEGLLPTTVFSPATEGCFDCPSNLADISSSPPLHRSLITVALVAALLWGLVLGLRTAWRWWHSAGIVRVLNAPLVLGGVGVAGLVVWSSAHSLGQPTPEIDGTTRALWLWQCVLVLVMAGGVALCAIRARRLVGRVAAEVIATVPDGQQLRATLSTSINDPGLQLVFFRAGRTAVDSAGREVPPAEHGSAVLTVTREDSQVAEIRYDERLVGATQQLAAAVQAAGLAIEHVAARAQLLAEVSELAASRQRIVDVGDAERRHLERDLHDGAQQRLIAVQVLLQFASSGASPERAAVFAAARQEVGMALEELRDLAHGIHPVALSDAGLGVGLRTLAETSRIPVLVETSTVRRSTPAVETAAYRLVADTLRAAEGQAGASVSVTLPDGAHDLVLRLDAQGLDPLAGDGIAAAAVDRFAAIGGRLHLRRSSTGFTIEAMVPCVW